MKILNEEETDLLKQFYNNGINLIITGETGDYDSLRTKKKENTIHKFLTAINDAGGKYLYLPECPGKKYYDTHDVQLITSFNEQINNFLPNYKPKYKIKASFNVRVQQVDLNDKDCIVITNLKGLKGYSTCVPETEEKIVVEFESSKTNDIYFIPYLGKKQKINVDYKHDSIEKSQNIISFALSPVQFGGIIVIGK